MITKDANGENSLFVNFAELALNHGYIDSIKNLFTIRSEEIVEANKDKQVEKPLRIFVKTSDKDICELRAKDNKDIGIDELTIFLNEVSEKLQKELIKTKIDELEEEISVYPNSF